MDISASIITLIGAVNEVVTICYNYVAATRGAPWALSKMIDELNNLRRVLESIERFYRDTDDDDQGTASRLGSIRELCDAQTGSIAKELDSLMQKLRHPKWAGLDGSKRQAMMKTLTWPLKEGEAKKTLQNIERMKSTLELALTVDLIETQKAELKTLKKSVRSLRDDDHYQRILRWLSAPDPSTNLNAALKRRHTGTGKWLLENQIYKNWKAARGSFLWLHGMPGCGKSILSSTIIEDLRQEMSQPDKIVMYFYFDFNDISKQHVDKMLRSLVVQLSCTCPHVPEPLAILYKSCNKGSVQPYTNDIVEVLQALLKQYHQVYIVLDALDECESRSELLDWMGRLFKQNSDRLSLIITSRKIKDLDDFVAKESGPENSFSIPDQSVNEDICLFVKEILHSDQRFRRWHRQPEVLEEIEERLINQAGGMFRWAACQLDALSGCRSLNKLRRALNSLPITLDETYERILCNIDPIFKVEALHVLQWLVYAMRPLTLVEVAELVAFDVEHEPRFDPTNRFADIEEVLDLCSSLTLCTMSDGAGNADSYQHNNSSILNSKGRVPFVRLAHFSVKEYLTSNRIGQGPAAYFSVDEELSHLRLAETCLSCLLLYEDDPPIGTKAFSTKFPIAKYAAEHWLSHFKKANGILKEHHYEYASKLFSGEHVVRNWIGLYDIDRETGQMHSFRIPQGSTLYYAVLTGSYALVAVVLQKFNDYEREKTHDNRRSTFVTDDHRWVPCSRSDQAACINQTGGSLHTPLILASWYGLPKIVELLLTYGANPNIYTQVMLDSLFSFNATRSALAAAVHDGRIDIAKCLLDHGADIHEGLPCSLTASNHAIDYGTALKYICLDQIEGLQGQRMHQISNDQKVPRRIFEKVRLGLLSRPQSLAEFDTESIGGFSVPLLFEAVHNGDIDMVSLLLDYGALIDHRNGFHRNTALIEAAARGNDMMVELLLDRGASINETDIFGNTALACAFNAGKGSTAAILMGKGAEYPCWALPVGDFYVDNTCIDVLHPESDEECNEEDQVLSGRGGVMFAKNVSVAWR